MSTTTLPNQPSELIRLALDDLDWLSSSSQYTIDMGAWHRPEQDGTCHICLAGAVMARSLGADRHWIYDPDDYKAEKLRALDCFRRGAVRAGLDEMGSRASDYPDGIWVTPYDEDPEQFVEDMLELADMFAAGGD